MRTRPILFSAPMVRALLDGSKTQTRRVIKRPLAHPGWTEYVYYGPSKNDPACKSVAIECGPDYPDGAEDQVICPYGAAGDRLYVRETFGEVYDWCDHPEMPGAPTERWHIEWKYRADGEPDRPELDGAFTGWKPSIHMPKEASRILLEIVAVRVERLNDCGEADAKAEGVMQLDADDFERPMEAAKDGWKICPKCYGTGLHNGLGAGGGVIYDIDCRECDTHAKLYRHLWESINGADSWAANPWVWVVEFKRVTP